MTEPRKVGSVLQSPIKPTFSLVIPGAPSNFMNANNHFQKGGIKFQKYVLASRERQDSVVGIATGYGLVERTVRIRTPVGPRIFSSPRRSDQLLGPPSLLSSGYRGLIPRR
jgi:hypothetical protein